MLLVNPPSPERSCAPPGPHPISGSPNVNINSQPALRVSDKGNHAVCCGPNSRTAVQGSTVFINGLAAQRLGDQDQHCGGMRLLIEGSPNVNVG